MKAVVVGSGPDALIAALALSRTGDQVTVLESAANFGGSWAPIEVAPGVMASSAVLDTADLLPSTLSFVGVGLPFRDESEVQVPGVGALTSVATHLAQAEPTASRWLPWLRALETRPAPQVVGSANVLSLARSGLGLRRLGADAMHSLMRLVPQSALDSLETVSDERMAAAMMLPALMDGFLGPMSPTSSLPLFLRAARPGRAPQGGAAAVITALLGACKAGGVALEAGIEVNGLDVEAGAIRGVQTSTRTMAATKLVWGRAPHELFALFPALSVPLSMTEAVDHVRARPVAMDVHFWLKQWPKDPSTGGVDPGDRVRIAQSPVVLERAFDAVKHGEVAENPAFDLHISQRGDGVLVSAAAFGLGAASAEQAVESATAGLERAFPGFAAQVLASVAVDGVALEGLHGSAHALAGEVALDQWWSTRPTPLLCHQRPPIGGVSLCGPATHGSTGLSGLWAAKAVSR